jgi:hypothetical protein
MARSGGFFASARRPERVLDSELRREVAGEDPDIFRASFTSGSAEELGSAESCGAHSPRIEEALLATRAAG